MRGDFRLGDWLVQPQLNRIGGPAGESRVEPKVMEVLVHLAKHAGEVLPKEQIIQSVWAGTFVTDEVLTNAISELRKALGDSAREPRFIETIPRRGYRLVAPLEREETAAAAPQAASERGSRRQPWLLAAAALLVAAGGAGALLVRLHRSPAPVAPPVPIRLTSDTALNWEPALSRDGKLVAYASDRGGSGYTHIWVQPVPGVDPIQRTSGKANDSNPSFSPDGSKIVFASQREGGGIYVMPTFAGEERLVAAAFSAPAASASFAPRFSPDGAWIAYGKSGYCVECGLHVVSASGGPSRRVTGGWGQLSVFYPVWSPDGARILFAGNRPAGRQADWWVVGLAGGAPVPTGAIEVFRRSRFRFNEEAWGPAQFGTPRPAEWPAGPDRVVFSAQLGDSRELWQVPVSRDGRVAGDPEPLTTAAGLRDSPSMAADGTLAFHSLTANVEIWGAPVEAEAGRATGPPGRVTENLARDIEPSVSADGRKLVFRSNRSGNWDVWLKDLETGKERQITDTPADEGRATIAGNGSRIAYTVPEDGHGALYVAPTGGGVPRRVCRDCKITSVSHLSHDGRLLLGSGPLADPVYLLEVASGEQAEISRRPSYPSPAPAETPADGGVYDPRFSPDGGWIAFHSMSGTGGRQLFVAPLRGRHAIPPADWIALTDGSGFDGFSWWSPGGNLLYFISNRDGYLCVWARPLEPATKRPAGPARDVLHLHEPRRSLGRLFPPELKVSVARDRLLLALEELTGEIWLRAAAR